MPQTAREHQTGRLKYWLADQDSKVGTIGDAAIYLDHSTRHIRSLAEACPQIEVTQATDKVADWYLRLRE